MNEIIIMLADEASKNDFGPAGILLAFCLGTALMLFAANFGKNKK